MLKVIDLARCDACKKAIASEAKREERERIAEWLEDRLGVNDTLMIVYPKGKLAALPRLFRCLELCARRCQVGLGLGHEGLVGAMPSRGDEHAACFLAGDDVGVRAEDLVAPDVIVVPVAIDDKVDGAASQCLGCSS